MATISCRNLHMSEMTDLTAETYSSETPKSFPTIKSIDITPSTYQVNNTYNDGTVDTVTGFNYVDISIVLADLTPQEQAWLFGATVNETTGGVISKSTDVPKTVAIMWDSPLDDQVNSRYACLYKGKFQLPKTSSKTREENGVTFADQTVTGRFVARKKDKQYKYEIDTTEDNTEIIEEWYTEVPENVEESQDVVVDTPQDAT